MFSRATKTASMKQPSSAVTIRHGRFQGKSLKRKKTSQAAPMERIAIKSTVAPRRVALPAFLARVRISRLAVDQNGGNGTALWTTRKPTALPIMSLS